MTELNIYQKLLAITEEAEQIPKNGYNEFSKYKYVKAVDALGAIRKLLIKHKVHLTTREIGCKRYRDGKNFHTEIQCIAKFINIDNPEDVHETSFFSVSADTLDKDIFKAKTNGLKYLFTQEFKLVTDDFIDTEQGGEHEDPEPEPITDSQAEEIFKLQEQGKISSEDFSVRLKKKFGVDNVDRLDTEEAEELIMALKIVVKKNV